MLNYSSFVGSNVDTYKFDVYNKSGQSKAGCPVTLKKANNSSRLSPANSTWQEFTSSEYGLVKGLDGNSITVSTATTGELAQILVEVDLSQLVTTKGNLETLKGLVRSIKVVAHARAEGSYSNTLVSKCNIMMWDSTQWNNTYMGERTGSSIQEIVTPTTSIPSSELATWAQARIGSDNKIYALISCPNSAGETIPSKVLLDYIVVYVDLRRNPDNIAPKNVELNNNWSLLIKGVSPVTLNNSPLTETVNPRVFASLIDETTLNSIIVKTNSSNKISLSIQSGGNPTTTLTSSAPAISKDYAPYNIVIQNKDGQYTLAVRYEGATHIDKISATSIPSGIYSYSVMQYGGNTQHANSFFDTWEISDHIFSDTELEIILSGRNEIVPNNDYLNTLAEIYKNPNLAPNFMDSRWRWNSNIAITTKQPDLITFTASIAYTGNNITIDVLPNTKYKISCNIIGDSGHIVWVQKSNDNTINQGTDMTLITGAYTNQLAIVLQNREVGNFTFSKLRVQRLD